MIQLYFQVFCPKNDGAEGFVPVKGFFESGFKSKYTMRTIAIALSAAPRTEAHISACRRAILWPRTVWEPIAALPAMSQHRVTVTYAGNLVEDSQADGKIRFAVDGQAVLARELRYVTNVQDAVVSLAIGSRLVSQRR